MATGYQGKILRVNLSTGSVTVDEPDHNFYRKYVGGWGFIAYYLMKELEPGIDPLGPANKLIFAGGVYTGTQLSGSGRSAVGAKSPLTGGFGEADVGGFFAVELVNSGYDALIVEGAADKPVYLWIHDDQVEIKDAAHLWGKDVVVTESTVKSELGDKSIRFAAIGRAGENQVVNACVMEDLHHAAGRCGMGAVMGSKNLKAVAARGSGKKQIHERDPIRAYSKWLLNEGKPRYMGLQKNGTDGGLEGLHEDGGLPTNNFKMGQFKEAKNITGQTMTDTILKDRGTCYACVVRCKREVEVAEGEFKTESIYGGPEYETVGALGSNCGVGNLEAVAKGNAICNAEGLDTIGGGMMVSFAMECFENGLITTEDTGGIEARFGDASVMVQLLEMTIAREGIGDLLAQGYEACIAAWGPEARKFAIEVKGQPLPMHEPRYKFALGLGYAISPTGADHVHNIHDTAYTTDVGMEGVHAFGILEPLPKDDLSPAKVRLMRYHTNFSILKNVLGMCLFLPYNPNDTVDIVKAVTGWDTSLLELMKVAERSLALARAFNAREGFTAKDDYLPDRFFKKFTSGPLKGVAHNRKDFKAALKTYYEMAGWNPKTGAPTEATCHDLDIAWAAEAMNAPMAEAAGG
ncbi:MAG: aldehyde ferredoxin oxidoreductase family protein [Gemmatimonadetes bacterium]|jgi:aldehyde:ferredoxin oxidoreductase|nr:aldehyde ferredoxin oxidoreductase family protein [Gemmatimonadota bacterium]MBT6149267.1 aldehyde ferredoxin oxidoreductase family protein [Gemmatimonadota bacterium]MBT7859013.1 aldehyde ferredoxin oxidoreductase family protein [Gemmatimonadota bacterium]